MSDKGIRVTIEDLETGESESREVLNDYIIICQGTCYVSAEQMWASGTHQLTVKGRKPSPIMLAMPDDNQGSKPG